MLGELAGCLLDLAAPADAASAAHALDIDAQRARRFQHGRADGKTTAPSGGHEQDKSVVGGHGALLLQRRFDEIGGGADPVFASDRLPQRLRIAGKGRIAKFSQCRCEFSGIQFLKW